VIPSVIVGIVLLLIKQNKMKKLIQFGLIEGSNATTNDDDLGIIKFGKKIIRGGSELWSGVIHYNGH